jgi:hypothetical protein
MWLSCPITAFYFLYSHGNDCKNGTLFQPLFHPCLCSINVSLRYQEIDCVSSFPESRLGLGLTLGIQCFEGKVASLAVFCFYSWTSAPAV